MNDFKFNYYSDLEVLFHNSMNKFSRFVIDNYERLQIFPGSAVVFIKEQELLDNGISPTLLKKLISIGCIESRVYFINEDETAMIAYNPDDMTSTKNPKNGEKITRKKFTSRLTKLVIVNDIGKIKHDYNQVLLHEGTKSTLLDSIDESNIDLIEFKMAKQLSAPEFEIQ